MFTLADCYKVEGLLTSQPSLVVFVQFSQVLLTLRIIPMAAALSRTFQDLPAEPVSASFPTYTDTNALLVPEQHIQRAIAANPLKTAIPAQPGDTLIDVNNDSTRRNKLVLIL